jgi:hypothetical protein
MHALLVSPGALGKVLHLGHEHLARAPPEASHRSGLFVRIVQSSRHRPLQKRPENPCGMSYNLPLLVLVGQHIEDSVVSRTGFVQPFDRV